MKERTISFYSGLSTKEFSIWKSKKVFKVGAILYGNYEEKEFKTLKDVFNYIRSF